MNPKKKAVELVEKMKDYVHGYVGSSMLTNYEYPDQILSQAKKAATIIADEMILEFDKKFPPASHTAAVYADNHVFWLKVKNEINKP
jgi:hypothetical protein